MAMVSACSFDAPFDARMVAFPFDVRRHAGYVQFAGGACERTNVVQSREDTHAMLQPRVYGHEETGRRLASAAIAFRVAAELLERLSASPASDWALIDLTKAIDALAAAAHAGTMAMPDLTAVEIGMRLTEVHRDNPAVSSD